MFGNACVYNKKMNPRGCQQSLGAIREVVWWESGRTTVTGSAMAQDPGIDRHQKEQMQPNCDVEASRVWEAGFLVCLWRDVHFWTQLTCIMWATSPTASLCAKSHLRRDAVHDIPLPQFPWIPHLIRHEVMHVPSGLWQQDEPDDISPRTWTTHKKTTGGRKLTQWCCLPACKHVISFLSF